MPNRILKETICTSEDINALEPLEEVTFYRLIVACDDYGRMDGRLPILRARLFPLRAGVTEADVGRALARLSALGCVARYEVDGRPYVCLPAWGRHQRMRSQRSKYPAPEGPVEANPGKEMETLEAAAGARLGIVLTETDRALIRRLAEKYTAEWVMEAMARAAEGPSRSWRYVAGVLRRWMADGGMDARPARAREWTAGEARLVNAQRYEQRAYSREELATLVEEI